MRRRETRRGQANETLGEPGPASEASGPALRALCLAALDGAESSASLSAPQEGCAWSDDVKDTH